MMEAIKYHAQVMGRGFVRMLVGAVTAAFAAAAVYGFVVVPGEGGYAAVADFVLAILALFIAFSGVYIMGGSPKKGAKK